MNVKLLVVFGIVVLLLVIGTANEFYSSAPWFLRWMDLRWWWYWGATAYTWVDSTFGLDLPGVVDEYEDY